MPRKILVAIDTSQCTLRALEPYATPAYDMPRSKFCMLSITDF
nr:hypothetical protein [uncultured Cupriavidus sp.]